MDQRELASVVLLIITVCMICGVGVLLLDKFGDSVGKDTTVANETVTLAGGAGTLANTPLESITSSINYTGTAVPLTIQDESGGGVSANSADQADGTIYVQYVYKADSYTTDVMENSRDAVADVADDWMALVVTIIILSLIIGMVLYNFAPFSRR